MSGSVFVTGGTGAIGRPSVRALVEAGHEVSALVRSPEKATWVRSQGATPVDVSLFDRDGLARAFASHRVVVNLATALPSTLRFLSKRAWEQNQRVRIEGSRTVVDAALSAGVELLVQESVSMIYPDGGESWITEDTAPDRYPIAEGNLAAEASAGRFRDEGGVGVVLRFGLFYGPGARHAEELFALAKRHVCVQIGPPDTFVSSIHVDDGGRAVAAALDLPSGVYNVVDDEPLTKREFADALASAARTTCWFRPPGRAAGLLGNRTTSLTRSLRVSNAKVKAASAWSPQFPSAREGWRATAEALESR